ncbi:MAG: helix-turn-helix domain-containing protein [Croceibacterium sp.]
METSPGTDFSPLVDLSSVGEDSRIASWCVRSSQIFPGLSVKLGSDIPPAGVIARVRFGAGELFTVDSPPSEVDYSPAPGTAPEGFPHLSLTVLASGRMQLENIGRRCLLDTGDVCLVDESAGFRLRAEEQCTMLFLRLPRAAALGRFPQLDRLFATRLPADEPGTRLLADFLLRLASDAPQLGEAQRSAMMAVAVQMLGVAAPVAELGAGTDWRVRRALDFIELNLSVAGIAAEDVARDQKISRRRLDQLMQETLGHSIAAHIWSRRLEQSAADLTDPRLRASSIAQIAFGNGFEDPAHFTRAFKRRYSVTPGQWRGN